MASGPQTLDESSMIEGVDSQPSFVTTPSYNDEEEERRGGEEEEEDEEEEEEEVDGKAKKDTGPAVCLLTCYYSRLFL